MVGKKILHYNILEKLGEGGKGIVYKAEDIKLKRDVAVKFPSRQIGAGDEERKRFKIEAQAAAALNHPNIATVYSVEEFDGDTFIVMEYIKGKELKKLITESGELSIEVVVNYTIQIAEGLKAAHEEDVIHRDIKSANIMVAETGQVKIMDFGLAKVRDGAQVTKEGTTLGTAAYMSPEQVRGAETDHRSDIWSFGVVLYEMLTGSLPFGGVYEQAVTYAIVNEEPLPVADLREGVPVHLQQIVEKSLRKNVAERYQNLDEILINFKSDTAGEYSVIPQVKRIDTYPGAGKTPGSTSKKPYPLYSGLFAILLLAAIAGFFIQKSTFDDDIKSTSSRSSIAVMYFENRSSEENLDKILVDLLTTNLARRDDLDVVSSQRLFDILKNLGKLDIETIDKTVATEVANKANVKTMLLGSIIQVGSKMRITSQLTNVKTGEIITSEQVEGEKIEDIFSMVDELTEKIGSKLVVSYKEPAEQPLRIVDVTTPHYQAYRFYQRGLEYQWRFDFANATKNFERAIGIDSTFAMAHLRLARQRYQFRHLNHYSDMEPARKRMALADKYSKNASPRGRLYIAAIKASFDREGDKSIALFSDLVKRYPDEKYGWLQLGIYHFFFGSVEQSTKAFKKTLALDPAFANAQNMLAYSLSSGGRHMEAIAAAKKYIDLQPDVLNTYDTAWDIYMRADELDNAMAICEMALKINSNWRRFHRYAGYVHLIRGDGKSANAELRLATDKNPDNDARILRNVAYFELYEGRYNEALKTMQKAIQTARTAKDSSQVRESMIHKGKMLIVMKRFNEAQQALDAARDFSKDLYPAKITPVDIIADYWKGIIYLRKSDDLNAYGQVDKILQMVDKNKLDRLFRDYAHLLQAEILLTNGHIQSALESIDGITAYSRWSSLYPQIKAKALSLSGKTETAVNVLRKAKDDVLGRHTGRGGGDAFDYFYLRSQANYLLGRFYESDGNIANAIEYYTKSVEQWKNADERHEELVDAKARLAKLNENG